jgi:hypothetical protein
MEFYLTSADRPAPPRKRKQVSNALEELEEYLQLKAAILHGRMRPMQAAVLTMGPEEVKKLEYKFPWRAAVDSLRRMLRTNGLEADYVVRKYQHPSQEGTWVVTVTYDPPRVKTAVPHAEPVQERPARKQSGRRSA